MEEEEPVGWSEWDTEEYPSAAEANIVVKRAYIKSHIFNNFPILVENKVSLSVTEVNEKDGRVRYSCYVDERNLAILPRNVDIVWSD